MSEIHIEWDRRKSASNCRKHRVSFEEAATVFFDPQALLRDDPDHSIAEERFVMLGLSSRLRMLVVCHALREGGRLIRIISARRANEAERAQYLQRWKP